MTPEIERLFEAASDLPPERRDAYLREQTSSVEVRREVMSLLAHDAHAQSFFSGAIESAAVSMRLHSDLLPGTRIGSYAVERKLGEGGMGAVYLATRADGSFEQRVAIKVIRSSNPASFLRERFAQERQILARLNHPNIARLLDGGETEAGLPYFVLEYVEGEDIDLFSERRSLDLRSRLNLVQQVCAAIQYAHQNLVVHRDLKPGNILVGGDGVPKLLDFGIAKMLDPALSGAASLGSTRVLTPEYASPEQMRGDPITTAADIYSLGAVLYRLVTGRPPHSIENLSPLDSARVISEQEVTPAPGVPVEVSAILNRALRSDPARRYGSADEFAADIQRFLDGKPVLAVPDSVGYRARKFLRRRWLPVSAVFAIVLTLAAGVSVALWQARRAERRFGEVRQLSNKFLFEFEEAIHNVAGATKARELLVKTSQEYLDRLAAEAGSDRELVHELAEAYHKLGDVQGSITGGNKGDTKAALASYGRALALRDSIGDEQATDSKNRVAYVIALSDLASLEDQAGDPARANQLSAKAVAISEKWVNTTSGDVDLLTAAATAYTRLAAIQVHIGKFQDSVLSSKRSLEIKQRALALNPGSNKSMHSVATGYCGLAMAEKAAGSLQDSVKSYEKAVNLLQQLTARTPEDVSSRRELIMCSWQLGSATKMLLVKQKKDVAPVLPLFERALLMGRQLMHDDPDNALVAFDVAGISVTFGATLLQLGRAREALAVLQPPIDSGTRQLERSPGDRTLAYTLSLLRVWAADCHKELHDFTRSLAERRAAADLFSRLVAGNPNSYAYAHQQASNLRETGDLLAKLRDYPAARDCYIRGLRIAEKLPSGKANLDAPKLISELRSSIEALPGGRPASRN
jgi:tetratricopeptide (TPR) repeat protein